MAHQWTRQWAGDDKLLKIGEEPDMWGPSRRERARAKQSIYMDWKGKRIKKFTKWRKWAKIPHIKRIRVHNVIFLKPYELSVMF